MPHSYIRKIHEDLVSKKVSVYDMVSQYLSRIQERDADIHAFLDVYKDDVLCEAARLDEKIKRGEEIGILEGIPLGVKDNIVTKGKKTTAGSKILENYIGAYDAFAVGRLKNEGMIMLGKTNLDEFGMGSSTENSAFGPTKNPHDTSRVPGGTSGGSAAAVAADMVPVALGTDTGGSIRQPASFCGVVGFKPSYGRVSRNGLIAMASSFEQIGPMTMSVEDAEIVFRAMEGKDLLDMTSVEAHEAEPDLKTIAVGVPAEFMQEGLDEKIKAHLEMVFEKVKSPEIVFESISLPHASKGLAAYYVIMPAEASSNLARYDGVRFGERKAGETLLEAYKKTRAAGLGAEVKRRILVGTYVLSHGYYDAYYVTAQKMRTLIAKDFDQAFKKVDFVLTPTAPTLPFKFGEHMADPLSMYLQDIYTVIANLAGVPAISIPAGTVEGLPVGIQLFAPRLKDYALLAAAKKVEAAL